MKYPMFDVHDQPDQNITSEKRNITTVPTQALTLLNNEFVLLQARHLAERATREAGSADPASQIKTLYRITLSREPSQAELSGQIEFIRNQRTFQAARNKEQNAELAALTDLAHVMLNTNEFVYID
jgi:hypothetical protein